MKRLLAILLCAALLCTIPFAGVGASRSGDINADGKINVRDLGLMQQYLNGWDVTLAKGTADVNADGKVNVRDLGLMQQFLNGWDVTLGGDGGDVTEDSNGVYVVPDSGFDPNQEVTITFAHTMGAVLQRILDDHIEQFNQMYPNIHIEHSNYGGWPDIAETVNGEIAAGTQPNLVYCYPDHVADYNAANATVALDNLMNHETLGLAAAEKADYVDTFVELGSAYEDGNTYHLAMSQTAEVMYYNKTFFDEHGLSVPTTWEEMWALCAQIKAIAPNNYPLGYDTESNWFATMCAQMQSDYTSAENGGEYLFNNDANKAWMKELRDYYEKGYFTTNEIYGSYVSNLMGIDYGGCYMCIEITGAAAYYTPYVNAGYEVGVAPIPQYDESNRKVISQGPNLCILKGADTTNQQIMASWLFMKYLCTNVEFQTEFSMAYGYMPVVRSAATHPDYAAWLNRADGSINLAADAVKVCIDSYDDYFVRPAFVGSANANNVLGDLLIDCLRNSAPGGDVDALIDDLFNKAQQACEAG